jgi:hypothetical protein
MGSSQGMDYHGSCSIFGNSDKNLGWKPLQSKEGCDLKQDCSCSVCYSAGKYQLRFCLFGAFGIERFKSRQIFSWKPCKEQDGTMSVFGYIFLALEKEHLVAEEEQQTALYDYAQAIGVDLAEILVEKGESLKRPITERAKGSRLVERCLAGDAIITMKVEWILSSASAGINLLRTLRENNVALYCIDLGQNITVDEKRKLIVSEGCAGIVQKIVSALAVCDSSRQGETVRVTKRNLKNQGKYIGGPVPFGWEVNKEKNLVRNEAQQKIIQAIIQMREDRLSYREISEKLKNEFDIQLSHAGVRRIMESDRKRKELLSAVKNAE